jgi:hypothetical protein
MTAMSTPTARAGLGGTARRGRRALAAIAVAAISLAVALSGCGTARPRPIASGELVEAQTFPYYRLYWAGRSFEGHPLAAVDGLKGYINTVGDSVYYGDCVQTKGVFGGGSCLLPLQVTTVIYRLHSNSTLGPQRNMAIRGVPATVYDEGRSIELYTGRVAIDVFSDTYAHALAAALQLRPLNARGPSGGRLPAPIYCPGLSGPVDPQLNRVMQSLPGRACQRAAAQVAFATALSE